MGGIDMTAAPTNRVTDMLGALAADLSEGALVTDPDVVEGYRYDRARTVAPGMPAGKRGGRVCA